MNRFRALFNSECNYCADEILEGDLIGYIEDEIACEDCCDGEEEELSLIDQFEPKVKNE